MNISADEKHLKRDCLVKTKFTVHILVKNIVEGYEHVQNKCKMKAIKDYHNF